MYAMDPGVEAVRPAAVDTVRRVAVVADRSVIPGAAVEIRFNAELIMAGIALGIIDDRPAGRKAGAGK